MRKDLEKGDVTNTERLSKESSIVRYRIELWRLDTINLFHFLECAAYEATECERNDIDEVFWMNRIKQAESKRISFVMFTPKEKYFTIDETML